MPRIKYTTTVNLWGLKILRFFFIHQFSFISADSWADEVELQVASAAQAGLTHPPPPTAQWIPPPQAPPMPGVAVTGPPPGHTSYGIPPPSGVAAAAPPPSAQDPYLTSYDPNSGQMISYTATAPAPEPAAYLPPPPTAIHGGHAHLPHQAHVATPPVATIPPLHQISPQQVHNVAAALTQV